MHGGPHKRPKLAENDLRAPLLPCAPNGPVAHQQATAPAAQAPLARPANNDAPVVVHVTEGPGREPLEIRVHLPNGFPGQMPSGYGSRPPPTPPQSRRHPYKGWSTAPEQGAVPAGGCRCARHARLAQEWDEQRWLDWPIGVDEMLARGTSGPAAAAPRFHATFAGGVHLGCFATATEAADAWDAEARRRGQRVLNSPRDSSGEVSAAGHLRAVLAALPSRALPPLPSDQAWRSAELAALLAAARSPDGLKRMWADNGGGSIDGSLGGSVVQHDHCSAAGVQLCWSYNAHAWGVRKARSCAEGWQDTKPLPSVQEAWAARPAFRARCVRAVLELDGCEMVRGGGEARRGAARSLRDRDLRPDAHAQLHAHAHHTFAPRLRQRACIFSGSWVLNFQPLVAAALLERYGAQGATVLDPCGGWGGRLLGAVAVGAARYIACEPCVPTHAALCAMAAQVTATGATPGTVCELHRLGFEDLALPPCSVDVALTSPPYFNLELYDDAPSQSHVRYATPAQWEAHFLRRLFERVHAALKPGRAFLINVASNRMLREGGCDLEAATHRCAAAAGFVPEPTIRMLKPAHGPAAAAEQGSVSGEAEGGGDATSGKFEPVFVFRKPRPAVPRLGAAAPPAVAVASWPTAGAECGPDEDSARLDALLDGL